jgi:hypothetical protein
MKKFIALAEDGGGRKLFRIVVALGCYEPNAAEKALMAWVRERAVSKQPYVADVMIRYEKRVVDHEDTMGVMEVSMEPVVVVSGEIGVLRNKHFAVAGDALEKMAVIMNTLKDLASYLADALGQSSARLDYENLICSVRVHS